MVRTLLDPTRLLYSIDMEQIAISLEFVPGQTSQAKLCVADSYDTVHFFVPPPAGSADASTLVSVGDVWNYTNSGTLKVRLAVLVVSWVDCWLPLGLTLGCLLVCLFWFASFGLPLGFLLV